ncbi:MAG: tkt [Francisellaceae bacterium]|nr:tkt [Francisellaceae bacterium]
MELTDNILANAIRALTIDSIEKVKSGHPGMPLGMSNIATVLWKYFLRHNPANPQWPNRDRFILSNGHGALLQYALLHLTGYDLSIEALKNFRQLHSKTPGHPEYGITPGVEATTGPLGQGLANAVGIAMAERHLSAEFNEPGFKIIDHYTYCFVGDGCLMEGVSHEAASLAGTQRLHNLIVFWDDNGISIDGEVKDWWQDNTPQRFEAYGWQVIQSVDGHDNESIKKAIELAQAEKNKPSLICCKTIIGYGSPKVAGTAKSHGSPLGPDELIKTKLQLNWPYEAFNIPAEIYAAWDFKQQGHLLESNWNELFKAYSIKFPKKAQEFNRRIHKQLPSKLSELFATLVQYFLLKKENIATRKSSQKVIEHILPLLPELIGGSADLSESNSTFCQHSIPLNANQLLGNYIFYGVREFGMSAIMNGIALYNGFIPYGGTFLSFLDYGRNAVRLAALMKIRVIFIYSHDSIGLGEDGPTHQPIEQLSLLRMTPNMNVWRPADSVETAFAWQGALSRLEGPSSIILSRQNLKALNYSPAMIQNIARGGYVLVECKEIPKIIILATGSEVSLACEAASALQDKYPIRVVSLPCIEVFLSQPKSYQDRVLPPKIKRIAVEASAIDYWYKWVGFEGRVVGLKNFGLSAPGEMVFEAMGLTVEAVIKACLECLTIDE